jgi:hypothetical protein
MNELPASEVTTQVEPHIDSELDAALSKSFGTFGTPNPVPSQSQSKEPVQSAPQEKEPVKTGEFPIEENRSEAKPSNEPKQNEAPKQTLSEDKNIPDPESIGDPSNKASAATKEGWSALKNNYKKAHRLVQDKDEEISKLKAVIAEKATGSQKELEEFKSKISELEKYRAMVDIQADPEFVSKFDQPIEKGKNEIKGLIQKMGVSSQVVDAINFSSPEKLQEIIDIIAQNKDRFTANKIERKVRDFLDLNDKRDEALEEQKNNYKETLEKKKKESFAKDSEAEGRMLKHIESKSGEKDKDGNPMIPFLTKKTVSPTAPQGEIDSINNHNALVDAMQSKLKELVAMKSPEEQAEKNIAAVSAHWFAARVKALSNENQKLKEELKKVSVVSSESVSKKPVTPTNGRNPNG